MVCIDCLAYGYRGRLVPVIVLPREFAKTVIKATKRGVKIVATLSRSSHSTSSSVQPLTKKGGVTKRRGRAQRARGSPLGSPSRCGPAKTEVDVL